MKAIFRNFSIRAAVADLGIIAAAVLLSEGSRDGVTGFLRLHPGIGFVTVYALVLLLPVYAMLQLKLLLDARRRLADAWEEWLGGLVRIVLFVPAALVLAAVPAVLAGRMGLTSGPLVGVLLTALAVLLLLASAYLASLFFRQERECAFVAGRLHERDLKARLDRLKTPRARFWFTLLLQPCLIVWINFVIAGARTPTFSAGDAVGYLVFSGYLPLRVLLEFEPPFTPLNLSVGLVSIVFFVVQVV